MECLKICDSVVYDYAKHIQYIQRPLRNIGPIVSLKKNEPMIFWPQLFERGIVLSTGLINNYPLDSAIGCRNTYPLDSDLSDG